MTKLDLAHLAEVAGKAIAALGKRDRPTTEPGGCDCHECGCIFIGSDAHTLCADCHATREFRGSLTPTVALALLDRLREAEGALRPFSEAAVHLHPSQPNDGLTLDGIEVRHWRAAASYFTPQPPALLGRGEG